MSSCIVIRYEIHLLTGSMHNAATNAPVWVTINGTRGCIITKYLEIAENEPFPFEPDNHDIFVLYDIDIGEVYLDEEMFSKIIEHILDR